MKNNLMYAAIVVVIIIGVFMFSTNNDKTDISAVQTSGSALLYKSESCDCCGLHSSYLQKEGNIELRVENVPDISLIKDRYNIPINLRSCHTTIIEGYFVEGHIPLEAIEKLLTEKPNIAGIAMPGMPSGSPGMPGRKTGDFVIYSVNKDGTYDEFMRI